MKIKYIKARFEFMVGKYFYQIEFENQKPPYLVNVFKAGVYQITYDTNLNANKSNAKDFLIKYLKP